MDFVPEEIPDFRILLTSELSISKSYKNVHVHYLHVSSKLTISENNAQKSAKITRCSKCNKSKTTGVTLYFDINPKGRLPDPLCCVLCLEVQNISIKSTLIEREVNVILEYKTLTGKPLKHKCAFQIAEYLLTALSS